MVNFSQKGKARGGWVTMVFPRHAGYFLWLFASWNTSHPGHVHLVGSEGAEGGGSNVPRRHDYGRKAKGLIFVIFRLLIFSRPPDPCSNACESLVGQSCRVKIPKRNCILTPTHSAAHALGYLIML